MHQIVITASAAALVAEERDARGKRCCLDKVEVAHVATGQHSGSIADEDGIDEEPVLIDEIGFDELLGNADAAGHPEPSRSVSERPHIVETAQNHGRLPSRVLQRLVPAGGSEGAKCSSSVPSRMA